jgi:hypothetical protein
MKRLEDFTVGDTFESGREVDRYRPVCYAAVSGAFNPVHGDATVGRAAGHQAASPPAGSGRAISASGREVRLLLVDDRAAAVVVVASPVRRLAAG